MRPRRESRAGRRRDNGVRRIRSDGAVRYPGVELPDELQAADAASPDADGQRLAPALDTGLEVQTRVSRQQNAAARRQRAVAISSIAAVFVLISALIAWRYASDRLAAAAPLTSDRAPTTATKTIAAAAHASASNQPQVAAAAATPIFASYGKLKIHLPVPVAALTEIGFHQASYPYALRMKTPMKDANLAKAAKNKSTGRNLANQPSGPSAVMTGYVLRMWRNRPGRPDTAADVGALAGTTVLAPVSGTIVKIKSYMLYGKYQDYELHIHPDGTKGLDLVMIHLTGLKASVGDHVDAGITPIAKVRKLSDKFHDQLADYTRGGGDHVHIQVNYAYYPGYKGLVGAISVPQSGSAAPAKGSTGTPSSSAGGSQTQDPGDYSSGD
jgi:murein DD-endopeptidase MepM/ murein hydrolase activator NlpD